MHYVICTAQQGVANSVVLTQYNDLVRNEYVTNSASYAEDSYDKEGVVQLSVRKYLKHC